MTEKVTEIKAKDVREVEQALRDVRLFKDAVIERNRELVDIWIAAYEHALEKGLSETQAAHVADRVLEQ